jgi:predicted metal-dependent phosphoesterase TrpH
VIDLHLHSTASDGKDTPERLVAKCAKAGLSVMALTDHDTVGGLAAGEAAAAKRGLRFVPGIELTAVRDRRDVHILGYFIDYHGDALASFVAKQRSDRIRRARVIGRRLKALGAPIDIEAVILAAAGLPVTRPAIAEALTRAGHTRNPRDAFDRFIGADAPAYEPRSGVTIEDVIRCITRAGGIASLAHPRRTGIDELIPEIARMGLGAIEAYHADHSAADSVRYCALAAQLGLGISGGSDCHGDPANHADGFGRVSLPAADFDDLCRRAGREVR